MKNISKNPQKNREKFIAYTDGSCNNRQYPYFGGSGYVVLDENGEYLYENSKGFARTTNNRMEMLAIISAIHSTPDGCEIDIYTDSQYSIAAFTVPKKHALNSDLIDLYHKLILTRIVNFNWVRGHNGNQWNEYADKLANTAYQSAKNSIY